MCKRASTFEELVPLVDLCRAGKLFEVQTWVGKGKPINPPTGHYRGNRKKVAIEYAIDAGFHSLVKVLLDAGTELGPVDGYCPMGMALEKRRLDIVELLVEHGYDPTTVNARTVLATWDPAIMEFFVSAGCDFDEGKPLAWALCNRIRTSLPLVNKYRDKFPTFEEQVNIALRHHCKEGNAKWVSLMLWAGGDPLSPGEEDPDRELDLEDGGLSALGFAALYNHYDLFEMKAIKPYLNQPGTAEILDYVIGPSSTSVLASILKRGLDPNNNERGGCSGIQRCVERFCQYGGYSRYGFDYHRTSFGESETKNRDLDSERSREFMKMIYLLSEAGGKWRPDESDIKSARQSLTKMKPEYTVEFISLMARFQAAKRQDVEALIRTPTIKKVIGKYRRRIDEQLELFVVDDEGT